MTGSPFPGDPSVAARISALTASIGPSFVARVDTLAASRPDGPEAGDRGIVLRAEVDRLVDAFALRGPREAMLLALPAAAALARPPVSRYVVGVVGLEAGSGNLLLGGNLEFPGTTLATTVHAEGVVALRAFARGSAVGALALAQARPCAHCRQVLTEFAWSDALRLIDPAGRDLGLGDLYPWPFAPADLGRPGAVPGAVPWPDAEIGDPSVPATVADALAAAGARAHVPYSAVPAAVVLELADGRLVPGSPVESVAHNPGIGPLQAALARLPAIGAAWTDIATAWIAAGPGPVDHVTATRTLLDAIAPGATLHAVGWR